MYSGSDRYIRLLGLCLLLQFSVHAQNVSSPYSILGLGDAETRDYGRFFGSGGTAISRREATNYNFTNPASLTALPFKTMHFDLAMRGKISTFRDPGADTATWPTKDMVVKRITMAFKVNDRAAFAFGLKPYSSVNYQFSSYSRLADNSASFLKTEKGSGGVNQFYGSFAYTMARGLSLGVTASYLFGTIVHETSYDRSEMIFDVRRELSEAYWGGYADLGLQYQTPSGRKWQHTIGLVGGIGTQLGGQYTTEYFEDTTSVAKTVEDMTGYALPLRAGLGYTASWKEKLHFSADGELFHWPTQSLAYTNSYTSPAYRLSTGIEYSKKQDVIDWRNPSQKVRMERYYLSAGARFEKSYMTVDGAPMYEYAVSMGGGLHMGRILSIYGGLELGRKGGIGSKTQIREQFTQFVLGLTLKDIWLGPKYTRRYY